MPIINEVADAPANQTTPYTMSVTDSFHGTLSVAGDRDWVRIFLEGGERYTFSLAGTGVAGELSDPYLRLYNANGALIGEDDDSGAGLDSFLTFNTVIGATGFYYISAGAFADISTGDYIIEVGSRLDELSDAPASNATTYNMEVGELFRGGLGVAGDRDRVEVALQGGTTYFIALNGDGSAGELSDPYLRLYNSAGTQVGFNDDGGPGLDSLLLYTPGADGTFYAEAGGFADSQTGTYELLIGDRLHEGPDAAADNTTIYNMQPGEIFSGRLNLPGDMDRVAITLVAGQTYSVALFGTGEADELADPVLQIYDSGGVQVAFNDDGGAGLDSYLTYTPASNGTYYIQARDFGNNDIGEYQIAVLLGSGPPTGNNDTFTGTPGPDTVNLLSGNDTYDGLAGDDFIEGSAGNDSLTGGSGADTIDGGGGTDLLDFSAATGRVFADIQIDQRGAGFLRFFTGGQAEDDVYANLENITGGAFADNLRGHGGSNVLMGGGVSDRLYGRGGNDVLDGGTGADALYGNLGVDTMTGGPDAGRRDRFIYFSPEESGVGAGNRDVITDFVSGEDRIEISRFDADTTTPLNQAFTFIGTAGFSAAGQLRYTQTGGNTIVQADFDGDGTADFEIELTGLLNLTAGDFLL